MVISIFLYLQRGKLRPREVKDLAKVSVVGRDGI